MIKDFDYFNTDKTTYPG